MKDRTSPGPGAAWRRAVALVRRPGVIVGEVIAVGAASALAATLPQQPDAEEIRRFAAEWPRLGAATAALRLHEITTSAWFLALVALAFLSLVAVQVNQWRRLPRLWSAGLDRSAFARAPFRRELPVGGGAPPAQRIRSSGRLVHLGSPVFHLGLLVVVAAGLGRQLFFRDALSTVFEGSTLEAGPGAFEAERGGWLSRPLALPAPVRVVEVLSTRYGSGALRQLEARLEVLGAGGPRALTVGINAPVELGGVRLYLGNAHGVAALLELGGGAAGAQPILARLEERGGELRGGARPAPELEVRLRSALGARPDAVEARVLRAGALLAVAELGPGAELALPGGGALRLVGLAPFAQVRGSHDPSRPFFFAGVALGILGVVLMLGFTRVDEAIFVEGDRLVVALRPHRFAPLYAERFERLVKEWQS